MEKPVTLQRNGLQMVGMLHLPEGGTKPFPGVALYHGFTGHKMEPHRLFVKMARALVAAGIAAVRFDFIGSGDSEGDFADMTLTQEIDDAFAVLEYLAALPEVDSERLGLLGLSLGGAIAATVAGRSPLVKSLALWAPVAKADIFFQDTDAVGRMEAEGQVDLKGNVLKKGFFDDLKHHDPASALAGFKGPVLLVHGDADTTVPVSHSDLYESIAVGRKEKVIISGADHVFSGAEWENQVISTTARWFSETL